MEINNKYISTEAFENFSSVRLPWSYKFSFKEAELKRFDWNLLNYVLCYIYIYIYIYISGLNITFFKVQTNCPEETMLHRTRWISDSTSDNFFLKESRTSRVCVALKTTWSYCTLTNIKERWVYVHQHRIKPHQFSNST